MKKILISVLVIFTLTVIHQATNATEEKDLPPEVGKIPVDEITTEPHIIFEGYANSKDVTIVAGVMGCVYYFCKDIDQDFCSDQEGILIVTGAETGRIPQIIKDLDVALDAHNKIKIKLSESSYFSGIRKILDVTIIDI